MIKCSMCDEKTELNNGKHLPYRWSEIHRKTADVHDSEPIFFAEDLYLCPKCTVKLMGDGK